MTGVTNGKTGMNFSVSMDGRERVVMYGQKYRKDFETESRNIADRTTWWSYVPRKKLRFWT